MPGESLPRLSIYLLLLLLPSLVRAQQPCAPPALKSISPDVCIFTQRQEVDLGEAIAEHLQRDFRIIEDEEVTAYLRRIGARISKHLPPNELSLRFYLVELPEANAFVLPGGRIYVSRKMVAFAQSEDELAGVLTHEIGHLIARQQAIEMSRMLREVLGVTKVTDRKDIFEKYNLLMDNIRRKPGATRGDDNREDADQIEADQIGLHALAAAGYDPQAHTRLFDRYAETRGKTGGFFSNLFGTTRPEQKRLRELIRGASSLPASCIDARAQAGTEEFKKWQTAVVAYTGLGRKEAVHGVLSKTVLSPPLRGEINYLRFSPDGKYVLAQDDSGINVLTREPFATRFRIRAIEAKPAHFTPDSRSIIFYNSDLRVEVWDLAEQSLKEAHELVVRRRLLQTALSPNGKMMAGLDLDLSLCLFDVTTGELLFQKKNFYQPSILDIFKLSLLALMSEEENDDIDWITMAFSPDGRYLAAGQRGATITMMGSIAAENTAIIIDTTTRAPLSLKGQLKTLIAGGFAFVGPDRLLGFHTEDPKKSAIVSLPAGEVVEQVPLNQFRMSDSTFASATRGNFLLVRPAGQYGAAVMNLGSKTFFLGNKNSAFDIYDSVFVSERINGELGLYNVEKEEVKGNVVLPPNQLGRLRTIAVSPDFKWLAASERSRGAVWDLTKGERIFHVRGFRGSGIADDGHLYADFPRGGGSDRQLGRLKLGTRQAEGVVKLEGNNIRQFGKYVLETRPAKKDGGYDKEVILDMHDAQSYSTLWSKSCAKEAPTVWVYSAEGTVVLSWAVKSKAAQDVIKENAALKQKLAEMKEKDGDYLLQVLDARTGNIKGNLLVETGKGSFRVTSVFAAADWVVLTDNENRVLIYSLATGEQKGKVFGGRAAIAPATGLLSVENEPGQLSLYSLATMDKVDQYVFTAPIALANFSNEGKKLFVLTADQMAYVLDVTKKQ